MKPLPDTGYSRVGYAPCGCILAVIAEDHPGWQKVVMGWTWAAKVERVTHLQVRTTHWLKTCVVCHPERHIKQEALAL